MTTRTLIKGGTVVTVDPRLGDLVTGEARVRQLAIESRDEIMLRAAGEGGARLGGDWIPEANVGTTA